MDVISYWSPGDAPVVNEQCEIELQLGKYKDKIVFDVIPMDVCHILLERPWQYDKPSIHDENKKTYKFIKDCIDHTLVPMKEEGTSTNPEPKYLLLS